MNEPFVRKEKYLVLKIDDLDQYLFPFQKKQLSMICAIVENGRRVDDKKQNYYVVVNQDEPYSEQVWKLIEEAEAEKVGGEKG